MTTVNKLQTIETVMYYTTKELSIRYADTQLSVYNFTTLLYVSENH